MAGRPVTGSLQVALATGEKERRGLVSIAAGTTCAGTRGRYQTPSRGGRLGRMETFLTDMLTDVGSSAPMGQATYRLASKPDFL